MAEQTYRIFAVIDMAADQDENLPNSFQVSDMVYDCLQKLTAVGCQINDILAYPDAINADIEPPVSILVALEIMSAYSDYIRSEFDEGGYSKAVEEGLRHLDKGLAFLRGCLTCCMPQIRELTRANLDEAPEPILHLLAHSMGLTNCGGMDRDALLQWIKKMMDGDTEEVKLN